MGSNPQREAGGRLQTGVGGLDVLLNGGLPRGGLHLVRGDPGAGKTLLAHQICFREAALGGRALFVTILAESHDRLIEHVRQMSYFDPSVVPDRVKYVSGHGTLEAEGLAGVLTLLARELRHQQASVLVLDGIDVLEGLGLEEARPERFFHDLQAVASLVGATVLLLAQSGRALVKTLASQVDSIIDLQQRHIGLRTARLAEVVKLRGSDHLKGLHQFEITSDGLQVYPRLSELASRREPGARDWRPVPFGIARLDEMLGGGLPGGSASLTLGPAGSGKTLLALRFLSTGAARGERGLFFGLSEMPERLRHKADGLGFGWSEAERAGLIEVFWRPPLEVVLDSLGSEVLGEVQRLGAQRVVIDAIDALREAAAFPDQLASFLVALATELRQLGVTSFGTVGLGPLFGLGVDPSRLQPTGLADSVMVLRQVEQGASLHRLLSIVKSDGAYDSRLVELVIADGRLDVADVAVGFPPATSPGPPSNRRRR